MTVKCLTEQQKNSLVCEYLDGLFTVKELGELYNRSPRTIYRVLNEKGFSPVKKSTSTVNDLPELTVVENITCFIKAVFHTTIKNYFNATK